MLLDKHSSLLHSMRLVELPLALTPPKGAALLAPVIAVFQLITPASISW